MRSRLFLICVLLLAFTCGCQAPLDLAQRMPSAADSPAEVLAAWNNNCATYGFDSVETISSVTIGSLYHGLDFHRDINLLLLRMQGELQSAYRPDIIDDGDEPFSALINSPEWYK